MGAVHGRRTVSCTYESKNARYSAIQHESLQRIFYDKPNIRVMRGPPCRRERTDRRVACLPEATYYKPRGVPVRDLEIVEISINELEAMRLCDMDGMGQVEAAQRMGVSRHTFWLHLKAARRKVIDALMYGKAIMIEGGRYVLDEGGELVADERDEKKSKP